MKLNHVAITVTDVSEARSFLEKNFGLKGIGKENPSMIHLKDDDGLILSLFKVDLFSFKYYRAGNYSYWLHARD